MFFKTIKISKTLELKKLQIHNVVLKYLAFVKLQLTCHDITVCKSTFSVVYETFLLTFVQKPVLLNPMDRLFDLRIVFCHHALCVSVQKSIVKHCNCLL